MEKHLLKTFTDVQQKPHTTIDWITGLSSAAHLMHTTSNIVLDISYVYIH